MCINELLYGPLQVKTRLNYSVEKMTNLDIVNVYNYVKKIEPDTKLSDLLEIIANSIYTRVVKVYFEEHIFIVGLILVGIRNRTYQIMHLSVHDNFRRQGLAKLMLMTFSKFVHKQTPYDLTKLGLPDISLCPLHISVIIPKTSENFINLFTDLRFSRIGIGPSYYMTKNIESFIELSAF